MTATTVLILVLAFSPALIAFGRGKRGWLLVALVNIMLIGFALFGEVFGGTLFGLVGLALLFVCFIWACTGRTRRDDRREQKRHAELIAALKAAP